MSISVPHCTKAPSIVPTTRGWRAALAAVGLGMALIAPGAQATPPSATPGAAAPAATLSHGRFKDVRVYRPAAEPTGVSLLLSGDAGWGAADQALADTLVGRGAMVVGIDSAQLFGALESGDDKCVFPDGDLENLSRFVQAYEKLQGYAEPVVIGQPGRAAGLAYALAVQSQPAIFTGLVSLGFCPELALKRPLCRNEKGQSVPNVRQKGGKSGVDFRPASVQSPWVAVAPEAGGQCPPEATRGFVAEVAGGELAPATYSAAPDAASRDRVAALYAQLNARRGPSAPPPPASVRDLPVVEVPATAGSGDVLAILLSGDGGWAGIDKELAAAMAADGVPVLGVDSLRYFWSKRTPESTAQDVDRLIRYYLSAWKKKKVVLMGFSQGADVLPFIVNRLPAATRDRLSMAVFLSPGKRADFEFKLTNWVSSSKTGLPTQPELEKLAPGLGLCVYGAKDKDSICPQIDPSRMPLLKFDGGHHFDGDNVKVARRVLDAARDCGGSRAAICQTP